MDREIAEMLGEVRGSSKEQQARLALAQFEQEAKALKENPVPSLIAEEARKRLKQTLRELAR